MRLNITKEYNLQLSEYEMNVIVESMNERVKNLEKYEKKDDMLCPHRLAKIEVEELLRNIVDAERSR